jgi:hypothetical protein
MLDHPAEADHPSSSPSQETMPAGIDEPFETNQFARTYDGTEGGPVSRFQRSDPDSRRNLTRSELLE